MSRCEICGGRHPTTAPYAWKVVSSTPVGAIDAADPTYNSGALGEWYSRANPEGARSGCASLVVISQTAPPTPHGPIGGWEAIHTARGWRQVYRGGEAANYLSRVSQDGEWICPKCGAGCPAVTMVDRLTAESSHREHCTYGESEAK